MNKLIIIFLCFLSMQGFAQKTPDKITHTAPFKVPPLFTTVNNIKTKSFISAEQADKIISSPLEVRDEKNNVYTVATYIFAYYRISVKQDETSGKEEKVVNLVSQRFDVSPMPGYFINPLKGYFIPGEDLIFMDIIVKDSKGRVMYAPDLKITIK